MLARRQASRNGRQPVLATTREVARTYMNSVPRDAVTTRQFVLTVTANFTAEPIGGVLRFWMQRLGLEPARLEFSGYNQVFHELMSPNGALASGEPGVN